jgi:hypothetical protein
MATLTPKFAANTELRRIAREAHESAIEAHGAPVPVALAWEFITQADPAYDAWIGKEIPRLFAAYYAAWGRDFARAKELESVAMSTASVDSARVFQVRD